MQAAGMMQRPRSTGVRVDEYVFSAQSVGRLANTLYALLHERLLVLPEEMLPAVRKAFDEALEWAATCL